MKLHYMGKYNLDPDSLPHGDHMPGAVQFKEAGSSGELGVLATLIHTIKFMDNFYIFDNGMVRQFLITGSGRNISAAIWRTPSL